MSLSHLLLWHAGVRAVQKEASGSLRLQEKRVLEGTRLPMLPSPLVVGGVAL